MSSNRGRRRQNNRGICENNKKEIEQSGHFNAVQKQFLIYRDELDAKHDRHEKLVKIGRDITIESKRIIFLLHTIDNR